MKSIITSDIITTVSDDSKLQSNSLAPYKFLFHDVIGIGAIQVVIHGDSYHLHLHEDIGKTYLKVWREDVGKLLTQDLQKKDRSRFYEFKTSTYKALLRRVDDDSVDEMKELGFCHVLIGDYYYTILKVIGNKEKTYGKVNTIIDESLQEKHEDDEEPEEDNKNTNVDDISEVESLSLFD